MHILVAPIDSHVHADDLALDVHQRSAGVAGIDDGVGLQVVHLAVAQVTVAGADDALGDRAAEAEGIADGEDDLADLHLVGVAKREGGEVLPLAVDAQQGDVTFLIRAEHLRGEDLVVIGGDRQLGDIGDDVVVRHHETVLADDRPGAEAGDDLMAAGHETEQGMQGDLAGRHFPRRDADHGGQHGFGQLGERVVHLHQATHVVGVELGARILRDFFPLQKLGQAVAVRILSRIRIQASGDGENDEGKDNASCEFHDAQ